MTGNCISLGEEKAFNPFVRVTQPSVQRHAKREGDEVATMKVIRAEKDDFKAK